MKLIKIVNAYMAMGILAKERMRYKDSLALKMARTQLKSYYDLFAEEERNIVAKVSKKDEKGSPIKYSDGHFEFASEESRAEYIRSMTELSGFEVSDSNIKVAVVSPPEMVSADTLEALDGFVIFEERDKNERLA